MSKNLTKIVAGGVAAAVLTVGAWALGNASSGSSSSTAAAAAGGAAASGAPQSGLPAPPNGAAGGAGSGVPGGPGGLTLATGTAARKAAAAALARYPGTVERVFKLPDGSYVVHVLRSSGEVHVAVSAAFKVTGTVQGGPPGGAGGAPPATPPSSSSPPSGTSQS